MDSYFNHQLLEEIVKQPTELLTMLKECKQLRVEEDQPFADEEQIAKNEMAIEKEMERLITTGKSGIGSWISAKQGTFGKIQLAGILGLAVGPWVLKMVGQMIKSKYNAS